MSEVAYVHEYRARQRAQLEAYLSRWLVMPGYAAAALNGVISRLPDVYARSVSEPAYTLSAAATKDLLSFLEDVLVEQTIEERLTHIGTCAQILGWFTCSVVGESLILRASLSINFPAFNDQGEPV